MANAHHIRPASGSGEEVNIEIDDTQSMRHLEMEDEGHQPPVLVLSRDAGLVETVRKAAPRGVSVTAAPDLDQVADRLPVLRPGVLVADTASTSDVASLVAQLTQHFPELVVVIAGKREDSASLMQLTAAGRIFRFLLTPLSHGQTRLALDAAVHQHLDLRNAGHRLSSAGSGEGGKKNYVMTYGALAAGLLVVIGGIWFGVKEFTGEPTVLPAPQPTTAATQDPSGVPERPDPVKAELALADEALAQGKLREPAGESALDYYRSALALDPNSDAAKAGIAAVADRILAKAEAALTAERLEDAVRSIETARDIDPTNQRLVFLETAIARERERLKLNQAQEVGNRVRTLLSQATDRIQSGRLISPSGASARDSLVEARRVDPTDPMVAQAIRDLTGQLTDEARKSLNAGKLDDAQNYINGARQLGAAGSALSSVERALADATRVANNTNSSGSASAPAATSVAPRRPTSSGAGAGPNVETLVSEARQRMNEGKLIDPAGSSAKDSLAALNSLAPTRPEIEELSRTLSNRLINSSKQAMAAKAYDRSAQLLAASREVGARFNEAAISQAERDLMAAREQSAQETVVSALALTRTKTVNPIYPESARKRGIEGWVELAFTVQPNGTVDDVEVRNASPADVFDDAAVRALRQWRFEPVRRNGEKVPQRAMVRLKFAKG